MNTNTNNTDAAARLDRLARDLEAARRRGDEDEIERLVVAFDCALEDYAADN